MSRNKEIAYSDLTDSGEDLEQDGVGLVINEDSDMDPSTKTRKMRKYMVSENAVSKSRLPSWCQLERLSRNERICLLVGFLVLVVIVVVFIVIGVVARPHTSSPQKGGGNGGTSPTPSPTPTPSSTPSGGEQEVPWSDIRLQSSVVPMMYDISLTVNMDTFQVTGSVNIACSVVESVSYIALHAVDMTVPPDGHRLIRDGTDIKHNEVRYDQNDFYIFNLTETLSEGPINITMNFNYTLRQDLAGFYLSSYDNANGNKVYLATTQFEPTDARKAFPCFDEPSLKANFSLHMTHQARYRAWFNMPPAARSEEDANGFVTTHFPTSFKMSTYLVAFIVSDFQCVNDTVTSTSGNSLLIQVCSNPVVTGHTHYALSVAKNVIMFYEREFGIPYPLPKQDLFAIPDFAAGAMENWGLITYRETALLYDKNTDPATSKQRVAVVIAHELAHQWFGDLVTMSWWDGLWLNEGFASFMEYIGTNSTEPSFNMLEQFVADDFTGALNLDGLNESHPILQTVGNPDEINSLFDSISYSKGASIIRMLRNYIGVDAFRSGITLYLNQHKYGNAETHELWEALQTYAPSSSATVTDIMNTWTKQMGYPVFTVNQTANTLTQTRFFSVKPDRDSIAPSPYNYLWKVPFNYLHFSNVETVKDLPLVTTESTSVQWPSDGWIKANVDQTGFYRVNYETSNWLKITEHLKNDLETSVLSAKDRAGLLDDAFALSYAGQLDTRIAMNLSIYLIEEREYLPWRVGLTWFYTLDGIWSLTPLYGEFKKFVTHVLEPIVQDFPTTSTDLSHLDIYLRSAVLQAAAHFGNSEVIENATMLFEQWMSENISVNPDLKSLVYGVGIANGGEKEWKFMWQKYEHTSDPYERRLFLVALAQSKQLWILNRYLNYSISKIRPQDTLSIIVYVSRNIYGRQLAWNFVQANWPLLLQRYGQGSFFYRFIRYITAAFATQFELQQVSDIFKKYPDAGTANRGVRQAIEVIRGNIAYLKASRYSVFKNSY